MKREKARIITDGNPKTSQANKYKSLFKSTNARKSQAIFKTEKQSTSLFQSGEVFGDTGDSRNFSQLKSKLDFLNNQGNGYGASGRFQQPNQMEIPVYRRT